MLLSRGKNNIFTNWWWTVDKILLGCIVTLIAIGIILSFSASPAVAEREGFGSYHFIKRHLLFAPTALGIVIFLSMQKLKTIRRFALIGYLVAMILVGMTFFLGEANRGASRWIPFFGFTLQPSEFVKPFFIIMAAWLFNGQKQQPDFPGNFLSIALFIITAGTIVVQPDWGMTGVISLVWGAQLVLSGVPFFWIFVLVIVAIIGGTIGYFTFPHFQMRILQFFATGKDIPYQIKRANEAFESSNFFGRGPGEGIARSHIPDAHTDFIYAVIAEEYGFFICLAVVLLYATIVIRALILSCRENNFFIVLSASGLALSFGVQAIINMASTLQLMPTKGMTLPFISYGGSSILASAIGMGMLLAITRKNSHAEDKDNV